MNEEILRYIPKEVCFNINSSVTSKVKRDDQLRQLLLSLATVKRTRGSFSNLFRVAKIKPKISTEIKFRYMKNVSCYFLVSFFCGGQPIISANLRAQLHDGAK